MLQYTRYVMTNKLTVSRFSIEDFPRQPRINTKTATPSVMAKKDMTQE